MKDLLLRESSEGHLRGCCLLRLNPKRCGLLGGVLFGEMKFVLSNFFSGEDLSISMKQVIGICKNGDSKFY